MPGRTRRATVKAIDYSKEQEFSDAEDMFEDEPPEPSTEKKRGRPRKNKVVETDDDEGVFKSDKPVYTEKGYDQSLPPLRERFPFLPEYEEDGSPKIELIVGRRPIDEKEDAAAEDSDNDEEVGEQPEDSPKTRKTRGRGKDGSSSSPAKNNKGDGPVVEYEYLIKYRGRSYLHLEWKRGADLESMNKSAKGIYRRFLKKIEAGVDDELENPEFDPLYVIPEKIIDEADQEITVELSDKELLKWEKEREKEIEAEKQSNGEDVSSPVKGKPKSPQKASSTDSEERKATEEDEEELKWPNEIDFKNLKIDFLRKVLKKEGPFYPYVEGCDNPYRDGYATEPPKKPRASYLFFQCTMRQYFMKKNPDISQPELMSVMGEVWRGLDDDERRSFQALADEETAEYERQKALLDKAQKPNGVWQPIRRCKMVLERLASDSFADIFLEPVDLEEFPDYEDAVDVMMDLGTVRERLDTKKYQAPEQFARDMRRIWNNCKIYNQHGSAIWHVADYMSKQFERLYHAWVLEFRERYVRWADPKARPWEHSCRIHDGKCGTSDDKMVLCDHCDGMYGVTCLTPPLKKVPKKAWHCPDCKPKLKSAKGSRMLSALAENAARKRAELGDIPTKKTTRTMYLVKWKGLGYEFCTWESKDDIGNDHLISQFHQREKGYSDEADMPAEILEKFMLGVTHVSEGNAGGSGIFPMMRSQLYAQCRGSHFLKFGKDVPKRVGWEMGPKTAAAEYCEEIVYPDMPENGGKHPRAVVECLGELVLRVAQGRRAKSQRSHTTIPPPLTGEYDAIIPITAKGLMMNVGEIHGSVAFLGYRQLPDGSKGPAEIAQIVRNVGDKIVAVDGVSTYGKSFKEVIEMLKETGKNRYAYMRFLENRYGVVDSGISSVGASGRYAYSEMQKKLATDRRRIVLKRKTDSLEEGVEDEESDDEVSSKEEGSDDEESDVGSEGSFAPDSDDDDLVVDFNIKNEAPLERLPDPSSDPLGEKEPQNTPKVDQEIKDEEATAKPEAQKSEGREGKVEELKLLREETTRSLALRLLHTDLGYSSDEGGDEDCAYFIDGVDGTFYDPTEVTLGGKKPLIKKTHDDVKEGKFVPTSRSQFSSLGDRSKLAAVMALTADAPKDDEFSSYPDVPKVDKPVPSPTPKTTKRSTVKVEQVDPTSGETVHIWANVEAAAATLQLPLNTLRQILQEEYDDDVGEEVGGFKWRYAPAGAKVTAGAKEANRGGGKKAKEAWLEFRDKLYDPSEPHAYKNGNRLRDYQVDGVNWLASTWYKKQGCVLADEMGLGKTVQIVCYIEHLFRAEKIHRPYLVVVPLSTVEHWRREFEGWTDMVCCVYHDRQRIWRDVMREYEWYYEDKPHTPEFLKFDVLVTTYDTLIGDFDVVSQIPFRVAVVDEAHRLRNQKGKLLECMREISARGTMQYGFQSRVLMSGTPLQNDLSELWTLLNFIEPFKFADPEEFQAKFGNMANRSQVEALQQIISPFMLRRVKEDVAKDIPAKEETVIDVELTSVQKQYYRAIFEHNHAFLNLGGTRVNAPKLMNIQMELRKVCNHPFLLEGIEHRETDRLYKEFSSNGAFEGKTPAEQQRIVSEHGYIMTSGKMVLLDKLLPKLRQEGHKILVFSQMVKMIDLISEYCDFRGFNYERLDGRVRGTDRQKAIDRFEREKDSFLFLLSTRAGGVGINLTAADICIIFDSDWNPQNDVQAQARCHRIGQTKDVRIYRLVTSRSFEQEMFDRASKKLGLEQAILGTFEKEAEDDKPSQQEMEQLLKKGAYALLEDDNDEVTKEFCADDIESILAKRTRTRVVEGAKTASWLNKQGMVVSKSKFTTEAGSTLDMDDPLFWQKVMPDFVTPSIMVKRLKDLEDEVEGKVRGPGRGRWRQKRLEEAKRKAEMESKSNGEANGEGSGAQTENGDKSADVRDEDEEAEQNEDESSDEEDGKSKKLSRGQVKKVQKFMNELKSMMLSIFDEDEEEEDSLSPEEKSACQKLLLTISVKQKMFTEEQRNVARRFLKRVEGDRRRRCRTSDQRAQPGNDPVASPAVREELMIRGKQRKKRRKRSEIAADEDVVEDVETIAKRAKRSTDAPIDDDGYLQHSDSEGDWSDVGTDIYDGNSKDKISRKEAARRRAWLADEDAASAAGRAWPVFPRLMVRKVLTTVLDKVIKHDQESGGVFSVPVPKDEFPEYYEQIRKPMDYGTMKKKLENGEYRSAQSMQKDFLLIMQNCRKFNADSSDIVKEAREQHLLRPKYLKEAAVEHNLFLAEDGSVLEIVEEKRKGTPKKKKTEGVEKKGKKERKTPPASGDEDEDRGAKRKASSKKKGNSKLSPVREENDEASHGRDEVESSRKRDNPDDLDSNPIPKKRKKTEEGPIIYENLESQDPGAKFADIEFWQKRRKRLSGSFKAARKNLTDLGPWQLPNSLSGKFSSVAITTLDTMKGHDEFKVFAKPVTEKEAPGYKDRIKNPMDFGTMRRKVESGEYGEGNKAAELLYKDFKQTFDNCLIYNDEGDVTEEASRILAYLPEAFAEACTAAMNT